MIWVNEKIDDNKLIKLFSLYKDNSIHFFSCLVGKNKIEGVIHRKSIMFLNVLKSENLFEKKK